MILFAIDPGPEKSGWCLYDTCNKVPIQSGVDENLHLIKWLADAPFFYDRLIIEMIQSYGTGVGASTFETCVWIGRFMEAFDRKPEYIHRLTRPRIKTLLCGTCRGVKDKDVWRAVTDRFHIDPKQAVGTKKNPGPLYGVKSHARMALAVAIAYEIEMEEENVPQNSQ